MVDILPQQPGLPAPSGSDLLEKDEVIAVVDDSREIIVLLAHYLESQNINTVQAANAEELLSLLSQHNVALVLLDIGLPDRNGDELLADLVPRYPDLGIIMVTGTTDIEVALNCLRKGADDYLTKPVSLTQFNHTIQNTLKKRRLAINNRIFQDKLQKTNNRMRFLHHLNLKMNTAYLNTFELRGILQAILVGITSDDGLRFNRAFLALYDEDSGRLEGKLAIGPDSREDAGKVWADIRHKGLQLEDILEAIQSKTINEDISVNQLIKRLSVAPDAYEHVLVQATTQKQTILVQNGASPSGRISQELIDILGEGSFAVVPLYSPSRALGVMIVDNFVTGAPITREDINALEIFASQASLAIEHSHLYASMAEKISALEAVTQELEKSQDLLIEAEKTTALGEMSAQLLHGIRNPLTSIGGTSRLLAKKVDDPYLSNFLNLITKEASKIENILDDLFSFVETKELHLEHKPLFSLVRRTLLIFYTMMKNSGVDYIIDFNGPGPTIAFDEHKIRQTFIHLFRNAIEAMPSGGQLHVSAWETEYEVNISITDSGSGISEAVLPHIKDPFFTTKTYGTGMGLTLVDQIIKAHRGTLNISNNPDGGTVVTITLSKLLALSEK